KRQARYTVGRHVDVVTGLPGFFVGVVEVGILDGVADENGAVAINAVLVVTGAVNLLTTNLEGVRADGVTGGQAPDGVVQITAQFLANAFGVVRIEVKLHDIIGRQGQGVGQAAVVFAPVIFNVRVIEAAGQILVEFIQTATEVDARQASAVMIALVTVFQRGEVAALQGQV